MGDTRHTGAGPDMTGGMSRRRFLKLGGVGHAIRGATLESEEERVTRGAVDWLGLDAYEMRALLEDPVFAARSEVDFSSLPTLPGGAEDSGSPANLVANRLREDGLDPLYVDLSPPGGEVRVVRP